MSDDLGSGPPVQHDSGLRVPDEGRAQEGLAVEDGLPGVGEPSEVQGTVPAPGELLDVVEGMSEGVRQQFVLERSDGEALQGHGCRARAAETGARGRRGAGEQVGEEAGRVRSGRSGRLGESDRVVVGAVVDEPEACAAGVL